MFVQMLHNIAMAPAPGAAQRFARKIARRVLSSSVAGKLGCVRAIVAGKELLLPADHKLPFYVADHETYDVPLEHAAAEVRRRDGNVRMIDVGANVGDSIVRIGLCPSDWALAIEGSARYLKYLRANVGQRGGEIEVCAKYVTVHRAQYVVEEVSGTGRLISAAKGGVPEESIQSITWPEIASLYPAVYRTNLLKVDTDGFDTIIVRSALLVPGLFESLPTLFFEYDPKFLRAIDPDYRSTMDIVRDAGYRTVRLYDNYGVSIGVFNLTLDRKELNRWLDYIDGTKATLYYDILCSAV